MIRSVSVPLGLKTVAPNIASTVWRPLYDQKGKVMYFDSATSPNVFWIPLADIDFTAGSSTKKLSLIGGETYTGNAAAGILAVGGVYDPNGNVIELIELAPGLTTSRLQEVYGTDAPG